MRARSCARRVGDMWSIMGGSTFGGRADATGAKISKDGYPFHKTGGPGCPAGAPAWPGPAPVPGKIQRGQLRPARIEGSGSTFGGRADATGAKISKDGYPFHKPGGPGCPAGAPAWPGPAPVPGEIQRGQLRPARIEGSGSTFGGRADAIGAKISKGGYPFHKTGGLLGALQALRYGPGLLALLSAYGKTLLFQCLNFLRPSPL